MNFFNKSFLKVVRSTTAKCAKDDVIKHASKVLDHVAQKGKVKEFYIGKTYIREKRKFDIKNFETWDLTGIQSRWDTHKKKSYGESGMLVMAAIDQESIPSDLKHITKEEYSLALEQDLLHQYKLFEPDPRVANKSFKKGRTDGDKSPAYALYLTYRIEPSTATTKSGGSTEDPKAKKSSPGPNNKK